MPPISRKARVWLLLVGLGIFSFFAHNAYRALSQQKEEQEPHQTLSQGMTLPADLSLEGLGGKASSLSDFDGKVVLINFWAGWCGPCIHEMPALYELHRRFQSKGFEVLAINMDEDPQDGVKILKQRIGEAPFPIFKGLRSGLSEKFNIEGLPFTVIVDRERKIRYAQPGEANWKSPEAIGLIEGLL